MNNPHRYHKSQKQLPPRDQLVMGIHSLTELFRHAPQRILKVFTSSKFAKERKNHLLKECDKWEVPVIQMSEMDLSSLCGSDSHQSFVAHVQARKYWTIDEFIKTVEDQEKVLVLMCDQIFDPQNFGAILRSAECFGVDGVVWSKNRGADLTPVSTKTSCGASEWVRLIRISNLAEGVRQFQEAGFEVIAAAFKPGSADAFHFKFSSKTVLVVGSEGEGIQPLILKKADHCLHIPMSGKIESLNVAQATTSLLTCYKRS